ncbi:MAG TPA: 6-phosphogluconolactonase [Sphaerochaeta sp.]|jgi:6-phosphogluconolactonase|nr:hypothetical protein [Spirochaetales bacterium]HOE83622.1 6-phosphogluconolactonase [Sphaerochaeta sp.]HOQ93770.1 6-phosphogluconolactonase [Sphaerochaeta sp.]HPK46527.1 6-phosphogluconolactonase [Sphaerochaeta sp.]HPY11426.1 6-phosphogluconolactonase [Sphaerochaeta sp.]
MKTIRIPSDEAFIALASEDLASLGREKEGQLHIALPGGRSAASVVKALLTLPALLKRITLYLVDERLEGERNLETLQRAGLAEALERSWMHNEQIRIPAIGEPLSSEPFDRVYLGIGEDGHFASLFPGSFPTESREQVIQVTDSPKPPKRRATLSYSGFETLARGRKVFLLFFGESKREPLTRLLGGNEGPHTLPCAFFTGADFDVTVVTDLEEQP